MNSITLAKDFDISKVSYNDVRMLDNGGKVVYVSYNKAPLVLQTPTMYAPFGIQKWTNDGRDKYTLNLSFRGKDNSKALQSFYDVLYDLDSKLVEDGFKNQQTWFKGKKYNSKEVLEALYTPLITPAKDKTTGDITDKYPATFKMTVPSKDGNFSCEVYDETKSLVDLNTINTKGSRVSALIQFAGLWFAGGKFGSSWRVVQMLVKPNQAIRGYGFKDDEDDTLAENKSDDSVDDPNDVLNMASPKSDDDNNDDDDVVDDSDDDLETTQTVKKVVMKRKT